MTSANVIEYTILKNGKEIQHLSQHLMCKTKYKRFLQFTPAESYKVLEWWYDEEEEYHALEPISLVDFLESKRAIIEREIAQERSRAILTAADGMTTEQAVRYLEHGAEMKDELDKLCIACNDVQNWEARGCADRCKLCTTYALRAKMEGK